MKGRVAALLLAGCGSVSAPPGATDAGKGFDGAIPDGALVQVGSPDAGPAPVWLEDVSDRIVWSRSPTEGGRTMADRFSGGVCVLDVDGRPPFDLFFAARGDSRLFVSSGGPWIDRTALLDPGDAVGCLAFDADGDGDDDLLSTVVGGVELHLREGDHFVLRADLVPDVFDPSGLYTSAAAGDVDGDGDLDVLVAGFMHIDAFIRPDELCAGGMPCTADFARHTPIANVLLARTADGYADRTGLAPELALPEPTLVVAIGDFALLGGPSLYVGNDLGSRYLDRLLVPIDGGRFADAPGAGFATNGRGFGIDTMGLTSGDLDSDGVLEHAVTSFEGDPSAVFDCFGPALCEDRGEALGMRAREDSFRWGNAFFDPNLDGHADLFEATGHYYTDEESLAQGWLGPHAQRPNLFVSEGGAALVPIDPGPRDALALASQSRGLARTDLDEDGRADLVLAPVSGSPLLLRAAWPHHGRWLRVTLRGRAPNTRGVGAFVRVEHDAMVQAAEVRAGEGYLGSFDRRLFFGLAFSTRARVRVRWPSGVETITNVDSLDRDVQIDEP